RMPDFANRSRLGRQNGKADRCRCHRTLAVLHQSSHYRQRRSHQRHCGHLPGRHRTKTRRGGRARQRGEVSYTHRKPGAEHFSERRTASLRRRQPQKMEAVGQLAGGVAHDFNNLLTVILGNVSLVQATLGAHDANSQLLGLTEKAALRAAELTSKLLGFSRQTTLRLESTDLTAALEETVALLR